MKGAVLYVCITQKLKKRGKTNAKNSQDSPNGCGED